MRNLVACLLLFASFKVSAQSSTKIRRVVELFPQQNFFLNGGLRANFGGVSRQSFKIVLPPGTVEWYYTVTTSTTTPSQSINLVPQLTRLVDPTGTTAILTSAILAPTGANAVDCLLMPQQEESLFVQMSDAGSIKRYTTDSRQNFRSGTVQVRDIILPGTYILGSVTLQHQQVLV